MFCSKAGFLRLNGAMLSAVVIAMAVFSGSPYQTPMAAANGFTIPIAAGVTGPYSYVVGIWPPDPSVGSLHMAITLTADNRPVTDAEVTVTGLWLNNGTITERVPAEPFSEPWVHELNIDLTRSGEWTFKIEINGSLGEAVIEAPLEVAGDEETAEQTSGEQPATVAANPSPEARGGEVQSVPTGQAPTAITQGGQSSLENQQGEPAPTSQILDEGGFSWPILALPIPILALAFGAWLYRRQRSSQLSRAGRRRREADRNQRRRR